MGLGKPDGGVDYWTRLRRASHSRGEMGRVASSMECRCAATGDPGLIHSFREETS